MSKGIKVTVAEDSPTQAEQLRYILEKEGYGVSVFCNGREALSAMGSSVPDIVISDILMPEMDGYQLCKEIKADERLRTIPVILLTSLSDPADVLKGLECGADNFITKPYDDKYLLTRIHHMLINMELRKETKVQMGVEIFFRGLKYFITAERQQILDLLLSTYETAVQKNGELVKTQKSLELLNEELEKRVEERTASLLAEIEERKKAEAEVRRLNDDLEERVRRRTEQLEEANRDLESFSYSVSHDLKAPLRAIDGFSNILIKKWTKMSDEDRGRLLGVVSDGARMMGRLIEDILAFSRAGRKELDLVDTDLEELAKGVVEEMGAANPDRALRFNVTTLPSAVGDRAALRQVFQNLLSNAVKFTRTREIGVIEIGGRETPAENVYYVRDNGVGFDAQYVEKLFRVFQRLHSEKEYEGTGIGLAIVKRFVTKIGGRVWAEGEVNGGATFYFTLPKAGNTSGNAAAPAGTRYE